MINVNLVLVGAAGYGDLYIKMLREYLDFRQHRLAAIVDPFAENSVNLDWIKAESIPIYRSLEDFYSQGTAELAILCSPIQYHRGQAEVALAHGSAILCEKPLCASLEDAAALRETWLDSGLPFGVGFQWSFSDTFLAVKEDILDGKFGKPLRMRTHISWKRDDDYYASSSWKGRLYDQNGHRVMDSITMNATAHYLHNIFFLLGDTMDRAALPVQMECSVYRGRKIETYDTCFLKGIYPDGCELLYCATHVGEVHTEPRLSYEFEKGTISWNGTGQVTARFVDGTEKAYGDPFRLHESYCKVEAMMDCVANGRQPTCSIDTAMPHLAVCEAITEQVAVGDFSPELRVTETDPAGVQITGLCACLDRFYETGDFPSQQGCKWASLPTALTVRLPIEPGE